MSNALKIFITGLGHHSALGSGLSALREGLQGLKEPNVVSEVVAIAKAAAMAPSSASREISTVTATATANATAPDPSPCERARESRIFVYRAPEVAVLQDVPESIQRRMPRLTKMTLAAAFEAAEQAFGPSLSALVERPERIGVVVGTAFGCLEQANEFQRRVLRDGPAGASPSLFAGSVHNSIVSTLSIALGIQGPAATVTTLDQSAIGAFRVAVDWIKQDLVDHVIVCAGDEVSCYHTYALAHCKSGLTTCARVNPSSNACTAVAGEAMVSFVLSRGTAGSAGTSYAELEDVRMFSVTAPAGYQCLAGLFGESGQWEAYAGWLGRDPQCFANLYGSLLTGLAVEVAIAALMVRDGRMRSAACVQMLRGRLGQGQQQGEAAGQWIALRSVSDGLMIE